MEYEINPITVDAIIVREGKILLIHRGKDPFQGSFALPGGFVDYGEKVEEAIIREVAEECQINAEPLHILGVYSGMDRDPRGPIISVVFICKSTGQPIAADDAASVQWIELQKIEQMIAENQLAFDHSKILKHYLRYKVADDGSTFWSDHK